MQHHLGKLLLQPEKPTSMLEIFVAEGKEVEESNLGTLFVMAEIKSRERGIKEKIDKLIEMIQNDYYASPTPDIESSLETTCQNLNLNFAEIIQKPEAWYKKINILVGVTKDDLLAFSHLGQFSAYLIRSNKVTQILNTQHQEPEEELFSQLTTGEIKAGDAVILSDYSLFDFFSLEKIKKVTTKLNPDQAVHQFKNLIIENIKVPDVLTLIIKYEQAPLEVKEKNDQAKKYLQDLYGSQESMEQLENLKQRTGRTLTASMWPNFKKMKKALSFKKTGRGGVESKHKKDLKLPRIRKKIGVRENKVLEKIKNINLFSTISSSKDTKEGLEIPSSRQPMKQVKPGVVWVIIILVLVFVSSLVYLNYRQRMNQRVVANQEIIAEIEDKVSQAEAALIYEDKEKANNLLTQALLDLNNLNQYNQEWLTEFDNTQKELQRLINKVNDIFEMNTSLVVDFSTIGVSEIKEIIKNEEEQLYILDNFGKVYKITPTEKSFSEFFENTGLKKLAVLEDEGLVLLTNDNKFYLRVDDTDKLLNITLAEGGQVDDIQTYGDRIYYLDKNKGIYKITRLLSDEASIEVWYDEDKNLINQTQDIIVDGNIWLNTKTEIAKLFRSKKQEFELSKLDKKLGSDLEIYTQMEWDDLYIIDKFNSRLLVVDKEGVTQKQFLNDKLKDAESLIISDDESVAWFNVNGQVLEISLKQTD